MVTTTPRRWFWGVLAATLVFRLWLSAALPMTVDEAYFILWGRDPALGYYDHPPMIGWLLAPLLEISQAEGWLRLPSVLLPAALALLVRHALPIRVDDVDELYAELTAADVLHPVSRDGVSDTDFGAREFAALDLDGNLLAFFRWETKD